MELKLHNNEVGVKLAVTKREISYFLKTAKIVKIAIYAVSCCHAFKLQTPRQFFDYCNIMVFLQDPKIFVVGGYK